MRNIPYKHDRQYAQACVTREYEQQKAYEDQFNPIANKFYGKDYKRLRIDQQLRVQQS